METTLEQAQELYLSDKKRVVLEEINSKPVGKGRSLKNVKVIVDSFDPKIGSKEIELPSEKMEEFFMKRRWRVKAVVEDRK